MLFPRIRLSAIELVGGVRRRSRTRSCKTDARMLVASTFARRCRCLWQCARTPRDDGNHRRVHISSSMTSIRVCCAVSPFVALCSSMVGLSVDCVLRLCVCSLASLAVLVAVRSALRCRAGGSPVWLPNSQVLCSTSSMEEGASARPHSPRQRYVLTYYSRTDCLCPLLTQAFI